MSRTPYDSLQKIRETQQEHRRVEVARARRLREDAAHRLEVAHNAAHWELPVETEAALWQVADAATARNLIELHEAEEKLRDRDATLKEMQLAHQDARRDEEMVARMKDRFLRTKKELENRREQRELDDWTSARYARSL